MVKVQQTDSIFVYDITAMALTGPNAGQFFALKSLPESKMVELFGWPVSSTWRMTGG